jgi:Xaa-Pro aminopeptidase
MAKLDPIISEFDTEEEAEAYDVWFRAQVEAALKEKGPGIPNDEVMAMARRVIEERSRAKRNLAA